MTMRSPRGFTLIEVLVALMIMSILAVMAWQGVDGIVRTRTASQERLEQMLRVNTVLAQFQQDLEAVQNSVALPVILPAFDGLSLRLTRRTPEGLQLVVWSLRGGSWLRWSGPAVTTRQALLESWQKSQQLIGHEAGQLHTLIGITDWRCYCFRGNAWSNCQSSASADPLKAVRLVLSFGEGSGYSGSVTREIALGPQ